MISSMREQFFLPAQREEEFHRAEIKLQYSAQVYRLGERFTGLSQELAPITMLDVTHIPGSHYGLKNVFVPLIKYLERRSISGRNPKMVISPETAILVEPSTGNGWVAFSDAAEMLGYQHSVVMPDGLPQVRYEHPQGRDVEIIKTPAQEYALGMPKKLQSLIDSNRQRLRDGEKIYVSPNHAAGRTDITVDAMSELGRQLFENLGELSEPLRVVVSMGNGASLCALGEYVKRHHSQGKVIATESMAYGGGYNQFAMMREERVYRDLFGIDPGNPDLMARFSTFGTNAPIGIELPLQTRAINSDLIDDYILFADDDVLTAYQRLNPQNEKLRIALNLANYSRLPQILSDVYGNSTLANIAVSSRFTNQGERVVAMAYDSRDKY